MRFLKRWAALALIASLPAFASGALSGRRAPGFSLPDSSLQQHDLYDYRGKVVLLEIMQTSCPSCRALTAELERIKAMYGDKVVVLSVVNPPDNMNTVRAYIKGQGVTGPMLFDSGQMAASYLKVTPQNPRIHLPHVFLIDREGMIRNDWGEQEAVEAAAKGSTLEAEIDRLLSGKKAN
jgi:peroxiredoxin